MTERTTGRHGPRTREQRISEMLKRAKTAGNKYGIGGREKTGYHKPKPVTLPVLGECAPDSKEG